MKNLNKRDFLYPPPSSGNIFLIYPWIGMVHDVVTLVLNLISNIFIGKYIFNETQIRRKLTSYFPSDETFFTDSGRSAILLAIQGLDISQGDEVIISNFNCPAVIDPIITSGATPVLIDCNTNCGISTTMFGKAINSRTKAVILTNIYGLLDERDEIKKVIGTKNIAIINDLSQSLVVPELNPSFFKHDEVYIFSFGPEKHIYCFGGGAIFSPNRRLIVKIKEISPPDIVNDRGLFEIMFNRIKHYITLLIHAKQKFLIKSLEKVGLIFRFAISKSIMDPRFSERVVIKRINPIQMVILLRKMKLFEKQNSVSINNYINLKTRISAIKKIELLKGITVNPLYLTILVDKSRYKLSKYLSSLSIPTVWNYIPLHLLPRYSKYSIGNFNNSNLLWKKVLSIPFRFPINRKQLKAIFSSLNNFS